MKIISPSDFVRHRGSPYYPFTFGILTFLWGLWMALPWDTYKVSQAWQYLSQLGIPEWALGAFGIVVGLFMVVAVLIQKAKLTSVFGLISFYMWLMISISNFIGSWHSVGWIIYGWLAIMSGLGYLNWKLDKEDDVNLHLEGNNVK